MKSIVAEIIVEQAAQICGPDSNFEKILKAGLELKNSGLNPVYIFDETLGTLEVTTTERTNNSLN